jgi:hypothetical protein
MDHELSLPEDLPDNLQGAGGHPLVDENCNYKLSVTLTIINNYSIL